jgi:hypothetical protein
MVVAAPTLMGFSHRAGQNSCDDYLVATGCTGALHPPVNGSGWAVNRNSNTPSDEQSLARASKSKF